jgi:D-alanyl-D-alanine carboxypeptidase
MKPPLRPVFGGRFVALLDTWRHQYDVPGIACAIRRGAQSWFFTSGFADPARRHPLGATSPFLIYSITKSFTAVCVLRLAQTGRLRLDDTLRDWLASLPLPSSVTLRHLLNHTSGIPNYGSLPRYHDAVRLHPASPWSMEEGLAYTCGNGLEFEPGSQWRYSNMGYMLLRAVIEHASGLSYRQCLHRDILAPLHCTNTFAASSLEELGSLVPGYSRLCHPHGTLEDVRRVYHPGWCATGVLVSTLGDVTHFYERLLNEPVLDATHLAQMLTLMRVPGEHLPVVRPSYGLGIEADPEAPWGPRYGHGGSGPGYSVLASVLPDFRGQCTAIALFCNADASGNTRMLEAQVLGELAVAV